MSNFRIVKVDKTNGSGSNVSSHYLIQKRFLFWWFDYSVRTHYYTYTDYNARHRNMPTDMAHITKRIFLFDSKEKAEMYLLKIKHPFGEIYKGELIGVVFDDNTWEDVFINYSFSGSWSGGFGYEYGKTLEQLKEKIDRRKIKTKISIA